MSRTLSRRELEERLDDYIRRYGAEGANVQYKRRQSKQESEACQDFLVREWVVALIIGVGAAEELTDASLPAGIVRSPRKPEGCLWEWQSQHDGRPRPLPPP